MNLTVGSPPELAKHCTGAGEESILCQSTCGRLLRGIRGEREEAFWGTMRAGKGQMSGMPEEAGTEELSFSGSGASVEGVSPLH